MERGGRHQGGKRCSMDWRWDGQEGRIEQHWVCRGCIEERADYLLPYLWSHRTSVSLGQKGYQKVVDPFTRKGELFPSFLKISSTFSRTPSPFSSSSSSNRLVRHQGSSIASEVKSSERPLVNRSQGLSAFLSFLPSLHLSRPLV